MSARTFIEERRPRVARWLAEPMLRNKAVFIRVALAAVMINLFAYVVSFFTGIRWVRCAPSSPIARARFDDFSGPVRMLLNVHR